MKIRITGAAGVFDAWLADYEGAPVVYIRWADGDEVIARPDAADSRCLVVWATDDERAGLNKAGFKMRGQERKGDGMEQPPADA